MTITFDPAKNAHNIQTRGLSFDLVNAFDWAHALVWADTRKDYGELRFSALGNIDNRLHNVVFTVRHRTIHVISFRKANARERKKYETPQPHVD